MWTNVIAMMYISVDSTFIERRAAIVKGVVNCQNSRDKGPPEGNSARG